MATPRQFERLLVEMGFSESRLDTSCRQLRDANILPNAGRGGIAQDLSNLEAASVVLAYVGSFKAVKSLERFNKLAPLKSADGQTLLELIGWLLEGNSDIRELRISRVRRRARLVLVDGTEVLFQPEQTKSAIGRFENETVLDKAFFDNLAALLRGRPTALPGEFDPEEAE